MEAWGPGRRPGQKRKGTWTTEHAENNTPIFQFLGRPGCARQDIPVRLSPHGLVCGLLELPAEGRELLLDFSEFLAKLSDFLFQTC